MDCSSCTHGLLVLHSCRLCWATEDQLNLEPWTLLQSSRGPNLVSYFCIVVLCWTFSGECRKLTKWKKSVGLQAYSVKKLRRTSGLQLEKTPPDFGLHIAQCLFEGQTV